MSGSDLNFRAAYIKKTGSMGNFRRDGGFQNISATTSSSSYRGSEPCICERSQLPAATSLPAESHFTLGRGQGERDTVPCRLALAAAGPPLGRPRTVLLTPRRSVAWMRGSFLLPTPAPLAGRQEGGGSV